MGSKPLYKMHAATVSWAVSHIGKTEEPMGSNSGPFVQACQKCTWLGGTGWPWCSAFTLAATQAAGFFGLDRTASAWDALDRAARKGWSLPPEKFPAAVSGDLVVFNIGSGHVAVLEKFESVGGETVVHTIDGNASDQVKRCERPLSLVRGFITWPEKDLPAGRQRKLVQVVGGESGKRKLVVGPVKVPLPKKKAEDKIT
jgi:hypothetical protein